jgi:mannan endo-1,6-alpha-mannosidase
MYNITSGVSQTKWQGELNGLLNRTLSIFFPNGVATEVACEAQGTCDTDMLAYKGLLAHYLVETIQIAPHTSPLITPKLTSSAEAAAAACTGGTSGSACPFTWSGTAGNSSAGGLGGELDALSFVQGLLVNQAASPVTETTGGSNGTSIPVTSSGTPSPTATKSAGVAIGGERISIGVLAGMLSLTAWLIL